MSHGKSDQEYIDSVHNLSRFCLDQRSICWLGLIICLLWGWFGYHKMPQRKDPDVPVRKAKIITTWPGNSAEKVEQLVSRKIEETLAQNNLLAKVESTSTPGLSEITIEIDESRGDDPVKVWTDVKIKLDKITDLPDGAGPISLNTDFGDTLALMLTVASPRYSREDVRLIGTPIQKELVAERAKYKNQGQRATLLYIFAKQQSLFLVRQAFDRLLSMGEARAAFRDAHIIEGEDYMAIDFSTNLTDKGVMDFVHQFVEENIKVAEIHPDAWQPVVIRDPSKTVEALQSVAGDKYSYRDLDNFTEIIQERLRSVPSATKVDRVGVLRERIFLLFSQERLASYGMSLGGLANVLKARNISGASGSQETNQGTSVRVNTAGEFTSEKQIGDVAVTQSNGNPVYLRDLVNVMRAYDSPPRFLTFLTARDPSGQWVRSRANIVTVQMRPGLNINKFGAEVDAVLADVKHDLPDDLIIVKTSDQPQQVRESVGLFNKCLEEAVVLVVLVSWIGFWEWRSALLMALAIPITLAMTFAFMFMLHLDIQQVSVASLIIALGLLVDDPVVAGDAIKHSLSSGHDRKTAAWLGPTKLATAILYATITNIVAYLPLMLIEGDTGRFLYSLPLVIACSLVASRISSMTFIPLLGYYILRPVQEPGPEVLRHRVPYKYYYNFTAWCVDHRWKVLCGSFLILAAGLGAARQLKTQFFPKDLQYMFFSNNYLPSDKTLQATDGKSKEIEKVMLDTIPGDKLSFLTTFVGGGAPRFWSTLDPESPKLNFSMVVVTVNDKHVTPSLVGPVDRGLTEKVAGVLADVRQLESGKPVGTPVSVTLYGQENDKLELQKAAQKVKDLLLTIPGSARIRDSWGESLMTLDIQIDPDRANLAGLTNADIAQSMAAALNGETLTYLSDGHRRIPVTARMRMDERTQIENLKNLYVYSNDGKKKVRLDQVASVRLLMQPQTICRKNYHRAIEVGCFTNEGVLASEVFARFEPKMKALTEELKSQGITWEVGGEAKEQRSGFVNLAVVLLISVAMIYIALLSQFKNVVKPLVVFAAIPYGMVGAFLGLWVMGASFGFMAFLGCASLVGVIVSHVIVLFDYIEEMHAHGENMRDSLLHAGIARLRPVFITVGATVIALFPLAKSGGPLWQPLCYTQIGGLSMATLVTLVLVPVLYTICVLDLKVLHWETPETSASPQPQPVAAAEEAPVAIEPAASEPAAEE
ncbi:efflux RND transporter permease subunit [bacterium]|nr:efflux RND transporter permease subunit [bacterium]